jgi:hypothetical protein
MIMGPLGVNMSYQVQSIDHWLPTSIEAAGAKAKSWFVDPSTPDVKYLWKERKSNTGEDWSELIACKLAELLGLPCAEYRLARYGEVRGVISRSFVPPQGELINGTELILELVPDYTDLGYFKRSPHTLERVLGILRDKQVQIPPDFIAPEGVETATDVLTGYLLLDAWIGNGDRHDENWAVLRMQHSSKSAILHLAPTYDHAACLGRELCDADRRSRLEASGTNRDIKAYLKRNRGAFFADEADKHPMLTIDTFAAIQKHAPRAASTWLHRLAVITEPEVNDVISKVPGNIMSESSKEFATMVLKVGKDKLRALKVS